MSTPHRRRPPHYRILFVPENQCVEVPAGTTVAQAAQASSVPIPLPCGGKGRCLNCRIRVLSGAAPACEEDRRAFREEEISAGWRLACRFQVRSDLTVDTRGSSAGGKESFGEERPRTPRCTVHSVSVPPPSLQAQHSAHARLCAALGTHLPCTAGALRQLSRLTSSHKRVRLQAAVIRGTCVAVASEGGFYGAAVDLGTTTVAGAVIELTSGKVLAAASAWNRQAAFGLDVLSRIEAAQREGSASGLLTAALRRTVADVLEIACSACGADPRRIVTLCAVGNPTMVHFFLGLDPAGLARAPYVGATEEEITVQASELALPVQSDAPVTVLPAIASNVGSDITADLLVLPPPRRGTCAVMVDLGTNAEIVLATPKGYFACSTAAGPAFEGGAISRGTRACPGAIDHVERKEEGDLAVSVLGGPPARGICGTGLIDAVAVLLDLGVVDPTGRLLPPECLPPTVPEAIRRRVSKQGGTTCVSLDTVQITASDIRQIQLAKGAVSSGIRTLLSAAALQPSQVTAVWIAGSFGSFVKPESCRRIGLVPSEIAAEIKPLGNAAGRGARRALLCEHARRRARRLARSVTYVELAATAAWRDLFSESLLFPDESSRRKAQGR